jgi:Protein of unknown function (DUF1592)/Protein of unknown function (DUF1588)/Protein of unknown function (DUF1585)/Protein of unknown function (DUF1595)/Protein of unknown function (DUF1587)/Planctomycete cytochrome C
MHPKPSPTGRSVARSSGLHHGSDDRHERLAVSTRFVADRSAPTDVIAAESPALQRPNPSRALIRVVSVACLLITWATVGSAADGDAAGFVKRNCLECHDHETGKGGIVLEGFERRLQDLDNAKRWEQVHDQIASGRMPPAKKARPDAAQQRTFLEHLSEQLTHASLAHQQREGRVPVRRLSTTAYENTLRSLLKTETPLAGFFPNEVANAGFDTVASGQGFSAALFIAYQEAADCALDDALAPAKYKPLTYQDTLRTGEQVMKQNPNSFTNYGCWLKDGAFVVPSQMGFPYTTILLPAAPRHGRYRLTYTAQALQNDGNPLSLAISLHNRLSIPWSPVAIDWHDVPADQPRTVTAEYVLEKDDRLHLYGWTLTHRNHVVDAVKNKKETDPTWHWPGPSFALTSLAIEGPLKDDGTVDSWPPASYRVLFDQLPLRQLPVRQQVASADATATPVAKEAAKAPAKAQDWVPVSDQPLTDAQRLLRRFIPLAFRRTVTDEDMKPYLERVRSDLERGMAFHAAMRTAYKAILCSPRVLFFTERRGSLDAPAIADRMAYALWCSPPDDELRRAATAGELAHAAGRRAQVERMLRHPLAQRFVRSFTDQWLDLQKINATAPDDVLYPEYDRLLKESSLRETRLFFSRLISDDRSLLECIDSDWTFVNERLARHYGLPPISGSELRLTTLPTTSSRGGLLTQASVLKVTADGAKTSPILRGHWVCERILGITPPPPPADVAKLEPDTRGATTIRQQLDKHRSTPACASCHVVIDPPGFALESFDVIGGQRDAYRVRQSTARSITVSSPGDASVDPGPTSRKVYLGLPVEQGYTLPDGRAFSDVEDYKRRLLEDPQRIARTLADKLLTYATGAPVQFADRSELDAIVSRIAAQGYGMRSLIIEIVNSRPFLTK